MYAIIMLTLPVLITIELIKSISILISMFFIKKVTVYKAIAQPVLAVAEA